MKPRGATISQMTGLMLVWIFFYVTSGCAPAPQATPQDVGDTDTTAADATPSQSTSDDELVSDWTDPVSELPEWDGEPGEQRPGDIDGDGQVGESDVDRFVVMFEKAFGSQEGEEYFDEAVDMDQDGIVTWSDLQSFLALVDG